MANSAYVTTGKPKIGGAIFAAPLGTTLPSNATEELNSAFVGMGYCSEDGLKNSTGYETEDMKVWGGDTVKSSLTSKNDQFSFTLVETMNLDVLKAIYGDSNVTGSLTTGIKVSVAATEAAARSWVVDMILTNDAVKRIVIPNASISELGDIVYKDDELTGYEVTLSCAPDTNGYSHYEYIKG